MKNLTLVFLILSIHSFAQSPASLDYASARWNVATTYPNGNLQNPYFIETVTKVYGIDGNTLMNGNQWGDLYVTADPEFLQNMTYLGLLREDSGFAIYSDTNNVIDTIYNFNLHVGDSVAYDFGNGDNYIHILNIDTILIDGNIHKRFHFSEPTGPNAFTMLYEVWIEGIGSVHGVLFPLHPVVFSNEFPDSMILTCFKASDTVYYMNPFASDCYISIVLSTDETVNNDECFQLYPNPANDIVNLVIPANKGNEFMLSIFDIRGELVMKKLIQTGVPLRFGDAELKKGIYIVKLESESGFYVKRFVKQ